MLRCRSEGGFDTLKVSEFVKTAVSGELISWKRNDRVRERAAIKNANIRWVSWKFSQG
ncbi:MAG: hypothetical protein JWN63_2735 [Candidatus Acidoferrum typicum]|nr:hypothetical protein [Candidatus Acidoferrum typicum]